MRLTGHTITVSNNRIAKLTDRGGDYEVRQGGKREAELRRVLRNDERRKEQKGERGGQRARH